MANLSAVAKRRPFLVRASQRGLLMDHSSQNPLAPACAGGGKVRPAGDELLQLLVEPLAKRSVNGRVLDRYSELLVVLSGTLLMIR